MAEFISQRAERQRAILLSDDPRNPDYPADQGFAAMGKPVPWERRSRALQHCRDMGLTDNERATYVVSAMAEALERDQPYEAMQAGMTFLDLTGTYRVMAVLLTEPEN